jgi:hypothetical protein
MLRQKQGVVAERVLPGAPAEDPKIDVVQPPDYA